MAILGAHVSIAGGSEKAPGRGKAIDADVIQIFTANQNQWKAKPLTETNIDGFREGMNQGQPQVSITHDSYLINLCSIEKWKLKRAVELAHDLVPGKRPVVQSVVGGKTARWEEMKGRLVEQLADWARIGQTSKTVICFKPHAGSILHDPQRGLWIH